MASQFVHTSASATVFRTRTGGGIDHTLALLRPVPVKLDDLQLTGTGVFLESASTAAASRKDELLVYENAAAAINRRPSSSYFRTGGAWVKDLGDSFPVAGQETIPAGAGIIVRKSATTDAAARVWINLPTYSETVEKQ